MKKIIIVLLATIIGGIGYSKFEKLDITIKSITETDEIPSGSGVVFSKYKFFIIGDDSPWLYTYKNGIINKKVLISNSNQSIEGRVNKKHKLDFEDIDIVNFNSTDHLFIISSGSKKIYRDTLYVMDVNNPNKILFKKNIRPLYDAMKKKAGLKKVNIEGLASDSSQVFLAHRGNHDRNVIFKINKSKFFEYLQSKNKEVPKFKALSVNLPIKDGMQSGFSSLQYIQEINSLLFTASLEGSKDAYSDGRITGSYIGLLPVDKPQNIITTILKKDNNILSTKLEGITVSEIDIENKSLKVISVSDNDNGKTELLEVSIEY